MSLHALDLLIVGLYVLVTVAIGFWISRRASQSMSNYFLGGNAIPWYMLGLSNASGMFDISGTMWMVYLLFVYGLKSVFIPWLWPSFNQIFLMIFLSVWLRRSGVMTGAAWITFRFGEGRGAKLSHLIVVVFALLNVIGFLAYGFIGIGKFAAAFLPFQFFEDPTWNTNTYGIIITLLTTLYVVKGGMFSVVFTEVLQFIIMTIGCVWVGIIAMQQVSPDMIAAVIPDGWNSLAFGKTLGITWGDRMPAADARILTDGTTLFSAFFMMMIFKGTLQSMAGPAPNYDMQRILSAKTPREAAKMSGFVSLVLLIPRYMLITGLTVLALVFFSDALRGMGDAVDFELILPWALREFIPTGLLGLLIAALLAAFMSTYAATVNAAPAYIVNDLYKRYIRPDAPERTYVWMSYAASIGVVIIGTGFGFVVTSLNDAIQWIVSALYGGYTAANLLKWYWWRFNAWGYFWGMLAGIVAAMLLPWILPAVVPLYAFPLLLAISLTGCIAGSLFTDADNPEVLATFYLTVRPWGHWGPVRRYLATRGHQVEANPDATRDALNVIVGIVWQTALALIGVFLVLEQFGRMTVAATIAIVTSYILKTQWLDRLEDSPPPPTNASDASEVSAAGA